MMHKPGKIKKSLRSSFLDGIFASSMKGLVLAPPHQDLEQAEGVSPAREVSLRGFRWHQDRPCLSFADVLDRTAAESFKGWSLWMPESEARLSEGETFRHQWIGCEVYIASRKVGEVLRLDPGPAGYDMVVMRDLRPGRTGQHSRFCWTTASSLSSTTTGWRRFIG